MFEAMSYSALQAYWWILVSVIGGILVFLMLVQGGQTLFPKLSENEDQKTVLINLFGHKWEMTFTTLVVFGGALFASFPLFYSTSFGGAYWVWMIILFAFIVQAVSYEFRRRDKKFLGSRTYEFFLVINGIIAPLLLGIAVSTFFTGSPFTVEKEALVRMGTEQSVVISRWGTVWHGLEALWNTDGAAFLWNIALGLAVFFLVRNLALLHIIRMVKDEQLTANARKCLHRMVPAFLVFFLTWLAGILFYKGFGVGADGKIYREAGIYASHLIEHPVVPVILLAGVLLVLYGFYVALFRDAGRAFGWVGAGTVLAVTGILLWAGLTGSPFYPSNLDWQSSLTVANSSSSRFTLVVMSYVSLLVPFVAAYMVWAWKTLDKTKIDTAELKTEEHVY